MHQVINYAHLAKAIEFYSRVGYTQIEVDWMVPSSVAYHTNKHVEGNFITNDRHDNPQVMVGSAEQGFLKAVADGRIELDRLYMSVSPCFRRGDIGPVNQEWFVKLELNYISLTNKTVYETTLMDDAFELFQQLGANLLQLGLYHEDDGTNNKDIVYWTDEITPLELGSYGYREIKGLTDYNFLLHYGTGLALPRFQLTEN